MSYTYLKGNIRMYQWNVTCRRMLMRMRMHVIDMCTWRAQSNIAWVFHLHLQGILSEVRCIWIWGYLVWHWWVVTIAPFGKVSQSLGPPTNHSHKTSPLFYSFAGFAQTTGCAKNIYDKIVLLDVQYIIYNIWCDDVIIRVRHRIDECLLCDIPLVYTYVLCYDIQFVIVIDSSKIYSILL